MGLFDTYCLRFIGVPYRWGGDDPMGGLDCSGWVIEALTAFGAHPGTDMTAQGLHDWLLLHGAVRCAPVRGAVVFYGGGAAKISHTAICLTDQLMVEAGGGGPTTTSLPAAIAQNACVRIRPVRRRADFVVALLPQYPGALP